MPRQRNYLVRVTRIPIPSPLRAMMAAKGTLPDDHLSRSVTAHDFVNVMATNDTEAMDLARAETKLAIKGEEVRFFEMVDGLPRPLHRDKFASLASEVKVWIQNGSYHVRLSNGRTLGMDAHGNTYNWTPDPPHASAMWGRKVNVDDLPPRLREVVRREDDSILGRVFT